MINKLLVRIASLARTYLYVLLRGWFKVNL